MQLLGQIPGADEAIKAAADHGNYEAVVLVIVMLSGLGFFGWLMKVVMSRHLATEERILTEAKVREERLAARVTALEDLVNVKLFEVVGKTNETMGRMLSASDSLVRAAEGMCNSMTRFSTILESRPCLMENYLAAQAEMKKSGERIIGEA